MIGQQADPDLPGRRKRRDWSSYSSATSWNPLPPLAEDVPPDFLAPELAIRGVRSDVKANWRIGC